MNNSWKVKKSRTYSNLARAVSLSLPFKVSDQANDAALGA